MVEEVVAVAAFLSVYMWQRMVFQTVAIVEVEVEVEVEVVAVWMVVVVCLLALQERLKETV